MTEPEFYILVERMRKSQKDYFSTRDKKSLEYSKQLERQVDNRSRSLR